MAYGTAFRVVIALMGAMVATQISNTLPSSPLTSLWLLPRSLPGLLGIVTSPFLHSSIGHLINNLVPFAALSGLILLNGVGRYVTASFLVVTIGGLLVWIFPRRRQRLGVRPLGPPSWSGMAFSAPWPNG